MGKRFFARLTSWVSLSTTLKGCPALGKEDVVRVLLEEAFEEVCSELVCDREGGGQ